VVCESDAVIKRKLKKKKKKEGTNKRRERSLKKATNLFVEKCRKNLSENGALALFSKYLAIPPAIPIEVSF
jgi:hypothetical protein